MDFLERVFRFSPDGGNGTVELLAAAIVAAGLISVRYARLASWARRWFTSR
jgi:hypothetical protein